MNSGRGHLIMVGMVWHYSILQIKKLMLRKDYKNGRKERRRNGRAAQNPRKEQSRASVELEGPRARQKCGAAYT